MSEPEYPPGFYRSAPLRPLVPARGVEVEPQLREPAPHDGTIVVEVRPGEPVEGERKP